MGLTSVLAMGKLAISSIDHTIDKVQDKYERFKGRESETHDYSSACRRRVLSMLVHGVYFRDLTYAGEVAAKLLGYQNDRAESYGKEHWVEEPCEAEEDELKKLGLAFFRRKLTEPSRFAPDLAIILRGTIPYKTNDLVEDLRIAMESQRESKRVQRCQELSWEVIQRFLAEGPEPASLDQICIAGHSLGAGLALLIGKHLASTYGVHIDTHLFNPPLLTFTSIATGRFWPEKRTHIDQHVLIQETRKIEAFNPNPGHISANASTGGQHSGADLSTVWKSLVGNGDALENASLSSPKLQIVVGQTSKGTGILASTWVKTFEKEALENEWNEFQRLKVWTPHFYVNPSDLVCLQYLKYYKKRHEKATIANVVDPQGIITRLFGKNAKYIRNVVPSADLHISRMFEGNLLLAHSLMQWHRFPDADIKLERFAARLLAGGFHFRTSARHLAHEAHMLGMSMLRSPRAPKTPRSPRSYPPPSHSLEPANARFDFDAVSDETRMLQYNYDNFVPRTDLEAS